MSTKKQAQTPDAKDGTSVNQFTRFANYVEDSKAELRKVTWPTLKETRGATLVVLGFVTVMSLILGIVDLGLSKLIQTILS